MFFLGPVHLNSNSPLFLKSQETSLWALRSEISVISSQRKERMESNMRQVTVLVVEDNYTVFALIKTALTTYPKQDGYYYCVAHASDGVYGLEQVWRLHPDIVLLDIHLPRLNGYEVLQSLRSGRNTTPVIMMTAS